MSSSKIDEISVHSMETDKSLTMGVLVDKSAVVEQDVAQQEVDQDVEQGLNGVEIVLEFSKEEMVASEGIYLCQEKTKKKIESKEGNNQETTQLSHQRTIDDKHYTVIQTTVGENEEMVVETDLSGDELQEFEDKWYQLWNPQLQTTAKHDAHEDIPKTRKFTVNFFLLSNS